MFLALLTLKYNHSLILDYLNLAISPASFISDVSVFSHNPKKSSQCLQKLELMVSVESAV